MSLLSRLRDRTINASTARRRAYWLRAYLRAKARARIWDKRMLNGRPGNVTKAVRREIMRGVAAGLHVTSTTGGRHASTSHHYANPGRAVDMAGTHDAMVRHQRACAAAPWRYRELFGPDNAANVKNGRRLSLQEGTFLENLHDNHNHVAPY